MDLQCLSQAGLSKTLSQSQVALPPVLSQALHHDCPSSTQQPGLSLGAQAKTQQQHLFAQSIQNTGSKDENRPQAPLPAPPDTICAPQGPSYWVWTTTLPSPSGHFGSEVVFIPEPEQITPSPGQGCIWGCRIGFMEGLTRPLPFPDVAPGIARLLRWDQVGVPWNV